MVVSEGARASLRRLAAVTVVAAATAGAVVAITDRDPTFGQPGGAGFPTPRVGAPAEVWAVGDGADGSETSKDLAAEIESQEPDRFLYLGDVYDTGTAAEFMEGYAPVYGRFDAIAAPTPGNHEWGSRDQGYRPYWLAATGSPMPDWYAFRAGGWQLLSLNSEASHSPGSAQLDWLRDQLADSPAFGTCRIAFWHQPRYSAGDHGDTESVEPLWDVLQGHARVVLAGHDHDMQRLRRKRGITQFVAGSGGYSLRSVDESDPRLRFARDGITGALRLRLRPSRAQYAFVGASGRVLDSGRTRCERG